MGDKPRPIAKSILEELYFKQKKSYDVIAKELNCSTYHLRNYMKKYGFKSRSLVDAKKVSPLKKVNQGSKNHFFKGGRDQYWKQQLIILYGHKCTICEFSNVVQVHHIDFNRKNNNVDNLLLLCPNCHFSIHHADFSLIKEDNKWSLSSTHS